MRGWCLSAMGQADEGIEQLLQGLATWRNTGVNLTTPFLLMTLAEVHGISGQPEQGLHRLTEAAQLVESTQERWAEAEMHRLRGTLLLTMNQHAAAEDSFRHALAVSKRQSAKLLELHATLDLARLWRNQGRRAEARDLLVPICNWFSEGVDTAILRDAQALLDSTE